MLIPLALFIHFALGVAMFIGWLMMTIKAFSGQALRLPFIATLADRWAV